VGHSSDKCARMNYFASLYSKTLVLQLTLQFTIRNTAEGSIITIHLLMMFVYSDTSVYKYQVFHDIGW